MSHGTPCFFVEQGTGCFAMFSEHALESHLREARRIIASKRKPARKPRGI